MRRNISLAAGAFTVLASPTFADITAADVWADIQTVFGNAGGEISAASEDRRGETLTLSDVTMEFRFDDGALSGELGDVRLTELGNGTVEVAMGSSFALLADIAAGMNGSGPSTMTINVLQTGLDMIASGTPEQTNYTYSADSVTVDFEQVLEDPAGEEFDGAVTLTAIDGAYELTEDATDVVRSLFNAGNLNLAMNIVAIDDMGSPGTADVVLSMASIASASEGTMGNFSTMLGLNEMIARGGRTDGTFTYESAAIDVTGDASDAGDFDVSLTTGSGRVTTVIDADGIRYDGRTNDSRLTMAGSQMPLPDASLGVERYDFAVAMPIAVSDAPEPFSLSLGLDGVTISDMLWSMFDPGQVLPRDPAKLLVDLSGTGNWLMDITSPTFGTEPIDGLPGQLDTLSLNDLQLQVAGAELTGTGDLTFDTPPSPMMPPLPVGQVDLKLDGANGLIDSLVSMGLLPQETAMGARMMLGIFAQPGDGEDTLVSRIEFTPGGGIVANGQTIR